MPTLKELRASLEKLPDTTGSFGGSLEEVPRIPTGIFDLDYAIGGGVPRGRMTEIFGPEGSGKTNLTLGIIREAQRLEPKAMQSFIDVEGTWDPNWAARMGVDVKQVYVLRPIFAEQVSDAMQQLVTATDMNVHIIDSIAALTSKEVAELSSTKQFYGGETKVTKRMTQKTVVELNKHRNAGSKPPAVIWINQTRANFDAGMYGNPEKTPGGNTPRFAYSLRLRTYSKNIVDATISKTLPVMKETNVLVKKYKVPVTALAVSFKVAVQPYKDLTVGEVDSWHKIESLLKASGSLKQLPKGKGWQLYELEFKTLKDARAKYREDYKFKQSLEQGIIAAAVAKNGFVMAPDDLSGDIDEDGEVMDPETGELSPAL